MLFNLVVLKYIREYGSIRNETEIFRTNSIKLIVFNNIVTTEQSLLR